MAHVQFLPRFGGVYHQRSRGKEVKDSRTFLPLSLTVRWLGFEIDVEGDPGR